MVMIAVKLIASKLHALLEVSTLLKIDKLLYNSEGRDHLQWARFLHFSHESFLISKEASSILRSITEDSRELITSPLNAMFD